MIGLYALSIHHRLVEKLEIGVTVIWLLYFMDVRVPPPIPESMVNTLSYPVTAILVALHWKRIAYVATTNIPLSIFIGTAMFSFLWSADLGSTLNISRGLLRTLLFGAYFATRYSLKEQMKILAWVFGLAAILTALVCLALPSYGYVKSGWAGIFPYKNYMGRAMILGAILFLIIALNNWRKSWLAWIGFGLAIPLILFSQSSTSLLLLLVLLLQMPLYGLIKQQYKLRVILLSLVCILVGAVAILIVANQETILVDVLGEGLTFNGRTPIWTLIIEKVLEERPWLGYGYGAFWSSDAGAYVIMHTWASIKGFPIPTTFNAHSGYMELFANLGFLGVILYGIVFVTVFIKAVILLFSIKKVEFFWMFQFLVFITLASLADVGIGVGATNAYGILSIAACLSISVEYKRFKKQQYLEKLSKVTI